MQQTKAAVQAVLAPLPDTVHNPIAYSIENAVVVSGLPRTAIADAIKRGQIITALIGKRRVILRDSLEMFIRRNVTAGVDPERSERARRIQAGRAA